MPYTPKYISEDSIPVQIPDDFSSREKLDAIELAESLLELDLNDGQELQTVSVVHEAAIKQRATCELAKGTESNDDVALGDLDDSGTTKSEYAAESFCKHYAILKDKIKAAYETANAGVFVYNTSKTDNREEFERLLENIDIERDTEFARRDSW